MKKQKNISCPICGKKFSDMEMAQRHIQGRHRKFRVSPVIKDISVPDDVPDFAENANGDARQSNEGTISPPLETEPIVLQLSYSLSESSPWTVRSDGRWRVFHHPEFPAVGPSGVDVERIQGLPRKAETISNVIINELDNSIEQTQAIILCSTREAAQTTHALVPAAASAITTHVSVGGADFREDKRRLKEQPHVVFGTLGRLNHVLEHKTINPNDIKLLCVESAQHLLASKVENDFLEFCEQLPKDIRVVFLSTKTRYKTNHNLGRLFTHEPFHFLVEEDPIPKPSIVTPRGPEPVGVNANSDEGVLQGTINLLPLPPTIDSRVKCLQGVDDARQRWFWCGAAGCRSKFPTKDDLGSHIRFSHWQANPDAALAGDHNSPGDDLPHGDKDSRGTERVMYLCGLCELYPPFNSSWAFGRHLKQMHLASSTVSVSKVGLATHSASDGPYVDTYLVHQTEETADSSEPESPEEPF